MEATYRKSQVSHSATHQSNLQNSAFPVAQYSRRIPATIPRILVFNRTAVPIVSLSYKRISTLTQSLNPSYVFKFLSVLSRVVGTSVLVFDGLDCVYPVYR